MRAQISDEESLPDRSSSVKVGMFNKGTSEFQTI